MMPCRSLLAAWLAALAVAAEEGMTIGKITEHGTTATIHIDRQLQSACGAIIGEMVNCYSEQCDSDFCDIEPGVIPAVPTTDGMSCEMLETTFCSHFDFTCCPGCRETTSAYLDCMIQTTPIGEACPAATCSPFFTESAMEVTTSLPTDTPQPPGVPPPPPPPVNVTDNNSTDFTSPIVPSPDEPEPEPAVVDEIEDVGTTTVDTNMFNGQCANEVTQVFSCYSQSCDGRGCAEELEEVDLDGPDDAFGDCQEFQDEFCASFEDTNECCPECTTATTAFSTCVLKQTVLQICPDASCDAPVSKTYNNRAFDGEEEEEETTTTTTNDDKAKQDAASIVDEVVLSSGSGSQWMGTFSAAASAILLLLVL